MTFAYNFLGAPALSVMNRMGQEPSGMPGKGLSGLDGAAQAGIIRHKVSTLGMLHEAILIADIAPRSEPCPCRSACCVGYTSAQEWLDAVNWLADNVRVEALDGHRTDHNMRRAAVQIFFGMKLKATKIAHEFDKDRSNVGVILGKVKAYLKREHSKAHIAAHDVLDYLVIKY